MTRPGLSLSVIVCSRQPPTWNIHERNVAATVGIPHEYLRILNSDAPRGICAVYNEGAATAAADILVFVHEDAFFMREGWGAELRAMFDADATIGLVGVAGSQYLSAADLPWHTVGMPFVRGRIVHQINGQVLLTALSQDDADAEVVAVDGVFLAMRRSLFDRVAFDAETFPRFHFYDLDIAMQVRRHARCVVTTRLLIKHFSLGKFDGEWQAAAASFRAKYADELPATCVDGAPDPDRARRPAAPNYDISAQAGTGVFVGKAQSTAAGNASAAASLR